MAITGTFAADFSSFSRAVDDAQVKLRSFESGSNRVESALSRMTDSFSGRKVVQDALLMVEAIERLGGVSKLTEEELRQVGVTATAAADKLKALGQDVPAGLQKIVDTSKELRTEQESLSSVVRGVATDFIALFSLRAGAQFISGVVEQAGALKDLSAQTRLSVSEIQILGGAMSEFGVDQESLARGLFRLSRQIAGGEDSVVDALHEMGIRLEDVAGLEGEQLFLKIENGLATLKGSLRDTTAATLFGDRLGMAMAGASEGIQAAVDKQRELNTTMSAEAVDALDTYGEAIERAQRSLIAMAANAIGPLAEGFNTLNDAVSRSTERWDRLKFTWAILADAWEAWSGGGTRNMAAFLDELNQRTAKHTEEQKKAAAATNQTSEAILKAAAAAQEYGPFLESAGNAAAYYAKQEELLTSAIAAHWNAVGDIVDRVLGQTALQQATAWVDAIDAMGGSVAQLSSVELANLQTAMLAGIDALTRTGQLTSSQSSRFAELAIQAKAAADAMRLVVPPTEDLAKAQFDYAVAIDKTLAANAAANAALAATPAAAAPVASSLESIAVSANNAAQGLLSMSAELYNAIRAAQAAEELNKIVPAWGRISPGGIGNPFPGPPPGIRPSLGAGGITIVNNITQPLGTPDQIRRAVGAAFVDGMRGTGTRLGV